MHFPLSGPSQSRFLNYTQVGQHERHHAVADSLYSTSAYGVWRNGYASVRFARKANPQSWIAMTHGFLAASGLTLLAYAGLTDRIHGEAMFGLILLLIASAGGILLNLGFHLAGKLLPSWLLSLHIGVAVAGTLLVAWSAWAD
jgi:hypothetical protein